MRLGFHYHIPMHINEQEQLLTPGYLGRFLDSLAPHCETVICFMHFPRSDELPQMDYVIESRNIQWVNIGPHVSVPRRTLNSREICKPVRQYRNQLDAMLIRGPSPLLPAVAKAAGDVPIALLLVGDYLAGIDDLPQPRWRKEAIRAWSYWNYMQQIRVAKKSLTFVNSHQLYEQLESRVPTLVETRTTTLSQADFYRRDDTCQQKPVRLLYTGRMDRAKGLFEMVDAVHLLVSDGYDVVLELVGWPQKKDTIIEELTVHARQLNISDRIQYHGYKAVGSELFNYYKNADIYVIASQSSEGFPRTIWEAMAHSLPVVATRVGSIPHYLVHEKHSLLVDPRDVKQISHAVTKLLSDESLRTKVIRNAFEEVKKNTLEQRTIDLVSELERWLRYNKVDKSFTL